VLLISFGLPWISSSETHSDISAMQFATNLYMNALYTPNPFLAWFDPPGFPIFGVMVTFLAFTILSALGALLWKKGNLIAGVVGLSTIVVWEIGLYLNRLGYAHYYGTVPPFILTFVTGTIGIGAFIMASGCLIELYAFFRIR
jgi:hypothetical protein